MVERDIQDQGEHRVQIAFQDGRQMDVSADLLFELADQTLRLNLPTGAVAERSLRHTQSEPGQPVERIPVVQEQVRVEKQQRAVAKVVVSIKSTEHEQPVEVDLIHEQADVRRVPANYFVAEHPAPREENGDLVIPLVEEVVVVEKRLMVREEIRIRTEHVKQRHVQPMKLRREHAEVQRQALDPDSSPPAHRATPDAHK